MIANNIQKNLDEHMQRGYSLLEQSDTVAACDEWSKAWDIIISIMDEQGYESFEDVDDNFKGHEFISNWAYDYEIELGNAADEDILFAQKRIDFCSECVKRYHDKSDDNIGFMKRAIAESYFRLGNAKEGERLFKQYLDEDPTWGWGWIGWSDEYWLFANKENKDSTKAIAILKKALDIEELEDRIGVLERLKSLYEELGMQREADEIQVENEFEGIPLSEIKDFVKTADEQINSFTDEIFNQVYGETKTGRNAPCPCGSGKKYKMCCGKI